LAKYAPNDSDMHCLWKKGEGKAQTDPPFPPPQTHAAHGCIKIHHNDIEAQGMIWDLFQVLESGM